MALCLLLKRFWQATFFVRKVALMNNKVLLNHRVRVWPPSHVAVLLCLCSSGMIVLENQIGEKVQLFRVERPH